MAEHDFVPCVCQPLLQLAPGVLQLQCRIHRRHQQFTLQFQWQTRIGSQFAGPTVYLQLHYPQMGEIKAGGFDRSQQAHRSIAAAIAKPATLRHG